MKVTHATLAFAHRLTSVRCAVDRPGNSFDETMLHLRQLRNLGLCRCVDTNRSVKILRGAGFERSSRLNKRFATTLLCRFLTGMSKSPSPSFTARYNNFVSIWTPSLRQVLQRLTDRIACSSRHGRVPFAIRFVQSLTGFGLHIYIRPFESTYVPVPNGLRSTTPSYIHGLECPRTAHVCHRRADLFAIESNRLCNS